MIQRHLCGAAALASLALISAAPAHATAECPIDRAVNFAGYNYDSAAFHNAVAQSILQMGYGCETEAIPGETLIMNQGLARGDIDVIMEVWTANTAQAFLDAEEAGRVERLGATFPDAEEGWYVPRYLVEGNGAPAPDLKSVADLADHKLIFEDPEEPGKGRFLNCVAGWVCEGINSKKLIAYGLEDDFTNIRPGSGAAIEAAVESAVLRKRPVIFYHWAPTALLGKHDFVKLEEPAYDEATWKAMIEADEPTAATAYPSTRVVVGANTEFTAEAPALREFFANYSTTSAQTSAALAYMRENEVQPEEAAEHFLETQQDVWSAWVPADVAERIKAAL